MPTNNEVAERIRQRIANVADEVKSAEQVVVRIPDWKPVDLKAGLAWMFQSLAEGFHVESRVTWVDNKATVYMKSWEYGEPEPDWNTSTTPSA